jgi:hypothetical protein
MSLMSRGIMLDWGVRGEGSGDYIGSRGRVILL